MRKYAAASFVVLGIVLTAYGLDTAEWTRSPWTMDEPPKLLIGGILSGMVGLFLASFRRQRA
jgi:hypothetical protein